MRSVCYSQIMELGSLGIKRDFLEIIFYAANLPHSPCVHVAKNTPPDIAAYIERENHATMFSYDVLAHREARTVDPWHGQLAIAREAHLIDCKYVSEAYHILIAYHFRSALGQHFWLITFHPYGRITHIFLPDERLIIFDLYGPPSKSLKLVLRNLPRRPRFFPLMRPRQVQSVAIIDMLNNYGHQCINTLSGLVRMIDLGATPDSIWVTGIEFFPKLEVLFPNMARRVRHFEDTSDMVRWSQKRNIIPARPTTNICLQKTIKRVYSVISNNKQSASRHVHRKPIIAITIRASDRKCLNLVDLVDYIYRDLVVDYPGVAFLIDGYVLPSGDPEGGQALPYQRAQIEQERAIEHAFRAAVPPTAVVASTIGYGMTESLKIILSANVYLSGVGTLQHKLAFFGAINGVVHGPTSSLLNKDAGHFSIEGGCAPLFLDPEFVEDNLDSSLIPSRRDYRVTNFAAVTALLRIAISTSSQNSSYMIEH